MGATVPLSSVRIAFSEDDNFETAIVGESFRQSELRALEARVGINRQGRRTFLVSLRAEPDNPHDSNAVAVLAADNGDQLGYLSRELAASYHSALLQRDRAEVPGILFGGSERKPSLGVWLDLTALNRILGIESAENPVARDPTRRDADPSCPSEPALDSPKFGLDQHGQPFNVRFNRARRAERDVCELLGLARGLLADGTITEGEAMLLHDWMGHRVFLLKPQTLFGLPPGDREILNLLERLRNGSQELPPGCEVTYELEATEILKALLRRSATQDALERFYRDFKNLHGVRPSALEMYEEGYNPRAVRERSGSWVGFVGSMDDLTPEHQSAFEAHRELISVLDTTDMVKSYKMVVLLAMLNADSFPGSISIARLAEEVERIATLTQRSKADFGFGLHDRRALTRLLEQNPILAWVGGKGTGGTSYFRYDDGEFSTAFNVASNNGPALQELVREVAEWRLAEYLDRADTQTAGFSTLKVSHANGSPILFLPSEPERNDLPTGLVDVQIDGETYSANFVKVAINVVRKVGSEENVLPKILRGWFGPDAGARGTKHAVSLVLREGQWQMAPIGRRKDQLQLWRAYSREEIPTLFGLPFSTAVWNAGFVKRPGHIFLLVTLDKSGHGSTFQYKDHFVGRSQFEWQSQNRTAQHSADGQDISKHAERGIEVHLFIRSEKKRAGGGSAPFTYCGDVQFVSWHGERPITVNWRLSNAIPDDLWSSFGSSS